MLGISGHFVGQGTQVEPVGDPLKQKAVFLREGFSSKEIRGAYQARNFVDEALQNEADRSILKRCKSPRETFDHLEKWYDPEGELATQKLYEKFHDFTILPNNNPIEALHVLEDPNSQMAEKGMEIPDTFLPARFVRALPDEYGHVKAEGSSSTSSASGSSHGGGSRPHGRCWRCNRRGPIREKCTAKESDFLAKYARCSGFGHEESTCSSNVAVLATELPMS